MIRTINEAINRKLASMSFTDIITGKVESVEPLRIRINDRIVIGQSFIEPMSLGLDDYSPSSALPLIVGETVQMVRYNNGQRFYILNKVGGSGSGTMDYTELSNLPRLVTTVDESLPCSEEEICNEVKLHRVSKSGSYDDVNNKPKINGIELNDDSTFEDLDAIPLTNLEIQAVIDSVII